MLIHRDVVRNGSDIIKSLQVSVSHLSCPGSLGGLRPLVKPEWLAFAWENDPVEANFAGNDRNITNC